MKQYGDITFKYLKNQKKRTILTIIGIVLSVALITSIGTMIVSMRDNMIKETIVRKGNYHALFKNVEKDSVSKIINNSNIDDYSIVYDEGLGKIGDNKYISIKNYDPNAFDMFSINLVEGRLPDEKGEIVVYDWIFKSFPHEVKLGDKIKLDMGHRKTQDGEILPDNASADGEYFEKIGEEEYTIVGTIKSKIFYSGTNIGKGITYATRDILSLEKNYDIYTKFKSLKNIHGKANEIAENSGMKKQMLDSGEGFYNIEFNERLLTLSAKGINASFNSSLIGILVFIVTLIMISTVAVIYNAFNISVLERISQFGVLRCVGASKKQIKNIVFKEAFLLALIGIPIGLALGVFAMKVVMIVIAFMQTEILEGFIVVISPTVFIISSMLGLITIYLSAYGPANYASKISPLEAVRNSGSINSERIRKVKKSRLAKKLLGIEGEIASKNLRRNKKRYNITIFSIIISIVLYIVFGSFVDAMLDMSIFNPRDTGDFRIGIKGPKDNISQQYYEDIKNIEAVDKAYKYMHDPVVALVDDSNLTEDMKMKGKSYLSLDKIDNKNVLQSCNIITYGDESLEDIQRNLKSGSIDKEKMNRENGVIIHAKSLIYNGSKKVILDSVEYQVGDEIEIMLNNDFYESEDKTNIPRKKVKILGIVDKGFLYDDYSYNGGFSLFTTEEVYKNITGMEGFNQIILNLKKNIDKEPVSNYLKDLVEKDPRYFYYDYEEIAKQDRKTTIVLSIFMYGFVSIIALIGALNIINTISTNIILRTRELSMLKAVGLSKQGIKKMVKLEGIFYGTIASFYGGVIGTLLSFVLFKILMGIEEYSWTIPWTKIVTAVVGAIAITLISSYIPLKRINDGNIMENMRMEQ